MSRAFSLSSLVATGLPPPSHTPTTASEGSFPLLGITFWGVLDFINCLPSGRSSLEGLTVEDVCNLALQRTAGVGSEVWEDGGLTYTEGLRAARSPHVGRAGAYVCYDQGTLFLPLLRGLEDWVSRGSDPASRCSVPLWMPCFSSRSSNPPPLGGAAMLHGSRRVDPTPAAFSNLPLTLVFLGRPPPVWDSDFHNTPLTVPPYATPTPLLAAAAILEALGEGEVLMPVDDRAAVGKATQGHFDGLMRWVVCRTAPPPATPPALIRPLSQWATGWLRTLALGEFERLHPLGAPSRLTSPLPYQIARSFHEEGDSKAALPYYRQALAACEALRLPQENSAVRAAVGAYALCLQAAGMYGDAAPLLNQSLQWLKGERGEFDPLYLTSLYNLGECYLSCAKSGGGGGIAPPTAAAQALACHRKALAGRRTALGSADKDTCLAMRALARSLHHFASTGGGGSGGVGGLGSSSSNSSLSMGGGGAGEGIGAWGGVEDETTGEVTGLLREAVDGLKRALGERHPITLTTAGELGGVFISLGLVKEATPLLKQCRTGYNTTLASLISPPPSDTHPNAPNAGSSPPLPSTPLEDIQAAGTCALLSWALWGQGELMEAQACQREALARRTRVYGKMHPDTLTSTHFLGLLLVDLALVSSSGSPQGGERTEGGWGGGGGSNVQRTPPTSPRGGSISSSARGDAGAGISYSSSSSSSSSSPSSSPVLQEAVGLLEEAWRGRRSLLGHTHRDTLASGEAYARALEGVGNVDVSTALLLEIAELGRRKVASGGEFIEDTSSLLSWNKSAPPSATSPNTSSPTPDFEKSDINAISFFSSSAPVKPTAQGALTLVRARALLNSGRGKESIALFQGALKILRATRGSGDPKTTEAALEFGDALVTLGRIGEGEDVFRELLAVLRRNGEGGGGSTSTSTSSTSTTSNSPPTLTYVNTMIRYAASLRSNKKLDEAYAMYHEARGLASALLGGNHPTVVSVAESQGEILLEEGHHEQALPLLHAVVEGRRSTLHLHAVAAAANRPSGRGSEREREREEEDSVHLDVPSLLALLKALKTLLACMGSGHPEAKVVEDDLLDAAREWMRDRAIGPLPSDIMEVVERTEKFRAGERAEAEVRAGEQRRRELEARGRRLEEELRAKTELADHQERELHKAQACTIV